MGVVRWYQLQFMDRFISTFDVRITLRERSHASRVAAASSVSGVYDLVECVTVLWRSESEYAVFGIAIPMPDDRI